MTDAPVKELRQALTDTWTNLVRGAAGILVLSTALLLLWQYYGYPATYVIHLEHIIGKWRYEAIAPSLYWSVSNVVMLFVIPFVFSRFMLKMPARRLGLGLGNWRLGLSAVGIAYAIMLPTVILVSTWSDFRGTYPLDPAALNSHDTFWVYESAYADFFVGWEFFFRGFMLFSLEPHLGPTAIAVQMIPFALMHVGKPVVEAVGSILAGVFLGVLSWRTRSIWYGVMVHAAVAISMDLIVYLRWGTG